MKRLLFLVLLCACKPELEDDASKVDAPRVLAVRAEPAEARPGEVLELAVLSTRGESTAKWSLCTARRPLADPNALCEDLVVIGSGAKIKTTVPPDACRAFGPDRPIAKLGEPAGRPADPDATGGYYLPGLVEAEDAAPVTFDVRLRCGLPGATQELLLDFERRYHANNHPVLASIDAPSRVTPRSTSKIHATWPAESAETYVAYDPGARRLVDRRESIHASWFATRGRFASARTGRDEGDSATDTENDWTAPDASGSVTLWIVLRDARGGVAFRSVTIDVAP
jgi:hypothetical protein